MIIISQIVYHLGEKLRQDIHLVFRGYSGLRVKPPNSNTILFRQHLMKENQKKELPPHRYGDRINHCYRSKSGLLNSISYRPFFVVTAMFLLVSLSCRNTNNEVHKLNNTEESKISCSDLPTQYQSYDEAKSSILQASFQIEDAVNTTKSSWIRGASYYSCDGQSGYFFLSTEKKDYLLQGMPIDVWEGFKGADSFGEYYNAFIRGRFYMYVGQR